jgi:uncharacterized membrane protein YgaE (UPF0421/DUF939 family)
MTIGARVLKTGIAVAVALWAGLLIGFGSPIIAAIAAIMTVQPSIYQSWKLILLQIQSNLLGALFAIGAVWIVGDSPIAVALTCIAVILVCLKIGTEETVMLTLVTVVVIMEAGGGDNGWLVAADRLGAIMTGIVAAFAVNITIAPPRHMERFVNQVQEVQTFMSRLLRTTVSNELREKVFRAEQETLRTRIRGLEKSYKLLAEERLWRRSARLKRARLLVVYKAMLESLERGSALIEAVEDHYFAVKPAQAWNRLIDRQIEVLNNYHEQLLWKWNGHIKPGAAVSAPSPETTALLSGMIAEQSDPADPIARARLLVITSAMFAYEGQLRRMDELISQYLNRQNGKEVDRQPPLAGSLSANETEDAGHYRI